MMFAITIVHVLACVVLVLVVLLQAGKGADIGAVFGGASTTIFGSSGAGSFLTRLTTGAAVVFMATSLALTYGSTRSTTVTIMPESAIPALPAEPLAAGGEAESGVAGDVAAGTVGLGDEAAGSEAATAESAGSDAADAPAAGGAAPEGAAVEPQPAEIPAAP